MSKSLRRRDREDQEDEPDGKEPQQVEPPVAADPDPGRDAVGRRHGPGPRIAVDGVFPAGESLPVATSHLGPGRVSRYRIGLARSVRGHLSRRSRGRSRRNINGSVSGALRVPVRPEPRPPPTPSVQAGVAGVGGTARSGVGAPAARRLATHRTPSPNIDARIHASPPTTGIRASTRRIAHPKRNARKREGVVFKTRRPMAWAPATYPTV